MHEHVSHDGCRSCLQGGARQRSSCQCPCRHRVLGNARPVAPDRNVQPILVEAQVSSMNTETPGLPRVGLEPGLPPAQDVSSLLRSSRSRLVLNVMPCRSSSRQTVTLEPPSSHDARPGAAISPKVMSGVSSTMLRISSAWASIRCAALVMALRPRHRHRPLPPPIRPFDRRRVPPKRHPTSSREQCQPPIRAVLGSIGEVVEQAWPPPPAHILNPKFDPMGIPKRIRRLRTCSSRLPFLRIIALQFFDVSRQLALTPS